MSAVRIAVVDYGAGNLVSIEQALETVGARVTIVQDADGLHDADALVVPGVGAAEPAMARLERQGLTDPIRTWSASGRPLLGICLGMQLLYEGSDEDGAVTLGLLAGRTVGLRGAPTIPHIGWNQVERMRDHPILDGVPDGADLYFVHSFVVAPTDRTTIVAETEHGTRFPSVVAQDNLVGLQFHPERSGVDGLRVLADFVTIVATGLRRMASIPSPGDGDRSLAPAGGDR
jgi:imidazole glycerol-phosphate synthase subunit HisH